MAKRKITVTVDEGLVEQAQRLGVDSLSAVVNEALTAHVERLGDGPRSVVCSMTGISGTALSRCGRGGGTGCVRRTRRL